MEYIDFDKIFTTEELYTPKISKSEFVQVVGKLLCHAKPNLLKCEYKKTDAGKENVKVTCQNGHCYYVNITGDSLCAIVEDVFSAMSGK